MAEPELQFASREDWEAWIDEYHGTSTGVWLNVARKGTGIESVTHPEALEVAIAYGWIDAQKGKGNETHWRQRFMPRTKRSKWSRVNCDKAEALIASGAMKPAGVREVERAKADGRWDAAYEPPSTITVPDDLQRELDARPAAAQFFLTLSSQNRYAILYRLQDAKKPETRARRLEKFVGMLERGETVH